MNIPAIVRVETRKRPVGDGHMFFESAHLAHILFAMDTVNDATGPEKETGFKKRVGHEMKIAAV